jgi:hypothetical protein
MLRFLLTRDVMSRHKSRVVTTTDAFPHITRMKAHQGVNYQCSFIRLLSKSLTETPHKVENSEILHVITPLTTGTITIQDPVEIRNHHVGRLFTLILTTNSLVTNIGRAIR